MITVHTKDEARRAVAEWRVGRITPADAGSATVEPDAVALVPTMGALHEGHLALIELARRSAGYVVVSAYVNPLQFGPGEDLETYPRSLGHDIELASGQGADLFFAPSDREMYGAGEPATRVVPGPAGDRLCGAYRPGHFAGVLTVVAKLFNTVQPDVAVFGRKDYQQAVLVRQMVADLDWPIMIEVATTVREADGLALSSRNRYLDAESRARALVLPRALEAAAQAASAGERDPARLLDIAREVLASEPHVRVQYVEVVHPETLEPVESAVGGSVVAAAVFVGETRLIDNVTLP
jgi:pantoate--beta-alanine ligase